MLRRKRTGVQSSVYLCVKAKADPDPARGLDGDEICIDMAVQERVDMKAESNIIIEFFFSASGGSSKLFLLFFRHTPSYNIYI